MKFILSFVVAVGALGALIGYVAEMWSMTTEVLIGMGMISLALVVFVCFVGPCFKVLGEAIRDAEESASR